MAKIDAAYDYFLSTYGRDLGSRYETHKKSELRSTYNNILKTNKMSPLYKISDTGDVAKYAIDIKEQANSISTSISALVDEKGDIAAVRSKKAASSSNEEAISAKYVGRDLDGIDTPPFEMEVKKLATAQVNQGNFMNPNGFSFEAGSYSFDLDTKNNSYEFQFTVNSGETNGEIQQKIARLINTSSVGLSAEIVANDKNQTALSVSSRATGREEDEEWLFRISSGSSWNEINKLGINRVTQEAENSVFVLNGSEHSSLSNTFTINRVFEISIKEPTEKPVTIGFKADTDTVADGVQSLVDAYNGMVTVGLKYSGEHANNRLYNEITRIASSMGEELKRVGVLSDEDGLMSIDRETMARAITSDESEEAFKTLNKFKNSLSRASQKASLNPMDYVNKIVCEYKNPGKVLSYPYAPSAYAGLLVDRSL